MPSVPLRVALAQSAAVPVDVAENIRRAAATIAAAAARGAHLVAFPELYLTGYEPAYVSSSLYWQGEERRCDLHLGARAMDNRIFAVLANYAGETGGYWSCGMSGAWGPRGNVLARATGTDEALVVADLDPDELRPFRPA